MTSLDPSLFYYEDVLGLGCLVVRFLPQRLGFVPRIVDAEFVVDYVILRRVYLAIFRLPSCRRDLCLKTPNTHKRQASMPPARFEPAIPANELQQT